MEDSDLAMSLVATQPRSRNRGAKEGSFAGVALVPARPSMGHNESIAAGGSSQKRLYDAEWGGADQWRRVRSKVSPDKRTANEEDFEEEGGGSSSRSGPKVALRQGDEEDRMREEDMEKEPDGGADDTEDDSDDDEPLQQPAQRAELEAELQEQAGSIPFAYFSKLVRPAPSPGLSAAIGHCPDEECSRLTGCSDCGGILP